MSNEKQLPEFPFHEARKLIMHLSKPIPVIYWVDFLLSVLVGWGSFVLVLTLPASIYIRVLLTIVAILALYRAAIFTHELTHLPKNSFRTFRVVWNLLCGFILMVPAFVYQGVHTEHHVRSIYGTSEDGEYWPFVHSKPYQIISFPFISLLLPVYFAFRFVVLTPFLVLSPKLRRFTWGWMSSLAIIAKYKRPMPESREERVTFIVQEWMSCLYGIIAIVLAALRVIPYQAFILWYIVLASSFVLNALRTLVAHRYRHEGDEPLNESDQLLDSVNVPGFLSVAVLWAPVGLRFHATHHLFMRMPYHRLGAAHRTLMNELPEDSGYRDTLGSSLWNALAQLLREASASTSRAKV